MLTLPNAPVTIASMAASGVLAVTAYFVKKSSEDRQHLINATLETKRIDAAAQAAMLNIVKQVASKS